MGFHGCPIEPSDWSDGPDEPDYDPCPDCDNGWVTREAMTVDGIDYPEIVNQRCDTCDGLGVIVPEPHEPDYFEDYD